MTRGRKPKPTRLKELTGNPGKRPLNAGEPRPAGGAPPCPSWLHRHAKAEWRRAVRVLEPLGLVTLADLGVLAAYCQAWAEFRLSTETLEAEGRTVLSGGVPTRVVGEDGTERTVAVGAVVKPHPAVAQQRTAWAAVRAFASLLGMDPSSRSRLSVPGAAEADPFEEFLGRRS